MERDDLIVNDQYSLDLAHSEEAGKVIRKKVLKVTVLLTLITAVEIVMGVVWGKSLAQTAPAKWEVIKWIYIVLTIIKAGYIVMVFMHLGEERKNMKQMILVPYIAFMIYLIWIVLTEAWSVTAASAL
jgi:cytochrome c oxidase subunit 4